MGSSNHEKGSSYPESSPQSTYYSSGKSVDAPPPTNMYPTHPPPPMYYPHPQGYPQYHNAYPPGYHYPQPAPYYGPPPSYESSSSSCARCCRSLLSCFIMIVALLFLMTILLALMLRPQLPVYKVSSFAVKNFTTSPTLAGQWDIKMAMGNPNDKLITFFSDFKVDIGYKDGVVAISRASGVALNTKEHADVDMRGLFDHGNGNSLDKKIKDDLVKERGTDSITFTLRVSSMVVFKSGSVSTRSEEIMAVCDGLKIKFQNNDATDGELDNKGNPIQCLLYV
ncbi:unnamed protein product [Sphenostylis stenocarpa]|uniref:Late embryogenesis abundant protein LEA-2 subgroup domain-containing protein n=1 Tax=Sphenostylis stenocarpa TaxID=92480 RepID=A0AA86SMX9_9FABA|nr:unnamed protein product [Sphenostylis stenocarpa]